MSRPTRRARWISCLWKPSKESEPGWDSPWGRGRPGWHIECSAMSHKHLGEVFDIHGGGIDLVFPHHENEIAQTRCAFGHDVMANVWMHNGFLQVEGEKMSKSLGNFITIRELLHSDKFGGKAWKGEVLRLAMMRSHYRQPIDWTVKALEEAEKTLSRWYAILRAQGRDVRDARLTRPCVRPSSRPCATISTSRAPWPNCTRWRPRPSRATATARPPERRPKSCCARRTCSACCRTIPPHWEQKASELDGRRRGSGKADRRAPRGARKPGISRNPTGCATCWPTWA